MDRGTDAGLVRDYPRSAACSFLLKEPEKDLRATGVIGDFDVSQAALQYHPAEVIMLPDNGPSKLSIKFSWPPT